MTDDQLLECSGCDYRLRPGDRFCVQCGRLSPEVVERGDRALRLQDIPSEQLRETVVRVLSRWLPGLDRVAAGDRLKAGPTVLLQGIDEQSGRRMLDTLKKVKVQGNLIGAAETESRFGRFANPGLIVTVLVLALDVVLLGRLPFVLLLLALAAPVVWSLLFPKADGPLVPVWEPTHDADLWANLARQYADVVSRADADVRKKLGVLTEEVFTLLQRLSTDSITAVAAGGREGELYGRLVDALRTAVDLARRMQEPQAEEKTRLRTELDDLSASVTRTKEWLRNAEADRVREAGELTRELSDVARSIDRILEDVRSVAGARGPGLEKERV